MENSKSDGVSRRIYTPPSIAEYREMGLGRHIIDRTTHPNFRASSWPAVHGTGVQQQHRLPNINYNSVLVTVIGNQWCEGGWHRLQDMLQYTHEHGYLIALEEVDDMSILPTDAIGIMRACAALLALDSGFEWCLMVDTDVHVEKDTLVRLLAHSRPVVFPVLEVFNNVVKGPLGSPMLMFSGQGLQPVVLSAMSCMLFNTKVFNCLDHYAWHGHDYHFSQSLNHFGHQILVDTDTVVGVTRPPTGTPSRPWDEMMEGMKRSHDSRLDDERHREPPPDYDPFGTGHIDKYGAYWNGSERDVSENGSVNGPGNGNPPEREERDDS